MVCCCPHSSHSKGVRCTPFWMHFGKASPHVWSVSLSVTSCSGQMLALNAQWFCLRLTASFFASNVEGFPDHRHKSRSELAAGELIDRCRRQGRLLFRQALPSLRIWRAESMYADCLRGSIDCSLFGSMRNGSSLPA